MMQTGEVVANIQVLNARFLLPEIDELVARKRNGAEKMALAERDLKQNSLLLNKLEAKLQEAHDHSQLPDEPTSVAALKDLVVRLRLDAARSEG